MSYKRMVIKQAAQNGTLVYYMNQSLTAPIQQPGPWGRVQEGYCAGLTVRWMRLAYAGRDYPTVLANFDGVPFQYFNGTDWQATVYQNKMADAVDSEELDAYGEYVLKLAQMQLGTELREKSKSRPTGEKLTRVVKRSYGCYWVHLCGDGAHAIAFRHARPATGSGPGEFHIFDPNYGHFCWVAPSATWAGIVDWFLEATDYYKDLGDEYLIARATPPVNHGHA